MNKKAVAKERFKILIQSLPDSIIEDWSESITNEEELYIEFEKVNADTELDDVISKLHNKFVICLDEWDNNGFNFYSEYACEIDGCFDLTDFISLFNDCQEWYQKEYDVNLLIKDKTNAWNNIAYWLVKENDLFFTEVYDLIEKKYNYYLDRNKTSRIACGVCLENKILYTGCSRCNGNYICYQCYDCLDKKNTCPYCRCDEMIDREPPYTAYSPENINYRAKLMKVLKCYTENPMIDKCEDCQCDIRYRDKSHYYIDDTGDVKVESLFCGDCFKKICN